MTAEIIKQIEDNSLQVHDIIKNIISDNTLELDNYINTVRELFLSDKPIPDGDLDKIILRIPVYIYHLIQIVQDLDVRKGVSAESAKYNLNNSLLSVTGTVAEKQAKAENATINNRVVQLAYKSAASLLQSKIDGAQEILNSAKKVQQRKLEEMKLTRQAGESVGF